MDAAEGSLRKRVSRYQSQAVHPNLMDAVYGLKTNSEVTQSCQVTTFTVPALYFFLVKFEIHLLFYKHVNSKINQIKTKNIEDLEDTAHPLEAVFL